MLKPLDPLDIGDTPGEEERSDGSELALFTPERQSPARRLFLPRAAVVFVATLLGGIVGERAGLVVGCLIGLIYVFVPWIAAGHFSLDLHDGEVLENARAPETFKVTEELAAELGLEPPALYRIDVERPQMCVSAVGVGRRVRGRIGISRALLQEADEVQLRQLLALAMARLWTGEATVMSSAAALSGLPLQLAQAPSLNGSSDSKFRDVECGLSPIGKFLLIVFAPFSRMTLSLAGAASSVLRSDQAAMRLGQRRFHGKALENAIRWLQDQQSPVVNDPMTEYNPAEAALFLASPFEVDYQRPPADESLPLWKRARFLITSTSPQMEQRIAQIRARAEEIKSTSTLPDSGSDARRNIDV